MHLAGHRGPSQWRRALGKLGEGLLGFALLDLLACSAEPGAARAPAVTEHGAQQRAASSTAAPTRAAEQSSSEVDAGRSSSPAPTVESDAAPQPRSHTALDAGPTPADVALVARCATEATRRLGWNPLPDGAHRGQVLRTAIEQGGMPDECAPLAVESNVWSVRVGTFAKVDWSWEPRDDPDATEIRYQFSCDGCETIETKVVLPRLWHCFSWVHGSDFGSGCHRSHGACERQRARFRHTIPCELRTGSAWCTEPPRVACFESPWACQRQAGGRPCVRDP